MKRWPELLAATAVVGAVGVDVAIPDGTDTRHIVGTWKNGHAVKRR